MNKHTEPKSRTPLIRMATGIAAAAAVLTITGGFGYLLLSMQNDVPRTPAASNPEVADQSAAYISYFRDYYELRAGHPVDFDFSTLCGTDFDETWEFDDSTVTLNAAICDGYEIDYIYTIEQDGPVTLDEEGFAEIPVLNLRPNEPIPPDQRPAGTITDLIDTTENEDGTYSIRVIGRYQHIFPDTPLSPDEDFYAQCLPRLMDKYRSEADSMRADEDENARPVSVSFPEQIPEYQALSAPLRVERTGVTMPASDDFTGAVVTPLSIRLINYSPADAAEVLRQMTIKGQSGTGLAITEQNVTVQKTVSGQEPQEIALALWEDDKRIGPTCYGSHITVKSEGYEPAITYATYYLSFTEPLDLSDIDYLTFSSEYTGAVTLPVNGEAPTEAEDTPDENLIIAETEEYPRFDRMSEEQRTHGYTFGPLTANSISYDESGNPVIDFTIGADGFTGVWAGDIVSMRMTPIGYDDAGNRYEIRNDEVMQGFKWTTEAQVDENGYPHVQLTLDPLSKEYYWVQDADGNYVSELGDPNDCVYWENLNIELYLNELRIEHPDGTERNYYDTGTEDDAFLKFRFGTAAYIPFEELTAAQRTREVSYGTVYLEGVTDENNTLTLDFAVKPNDSLNVQPGDALTFVPLPLCYDSNWAVIQDGSSYNTDGCAAEEPDADGWYHFTMSLKHSDASPMLIDCRLNLLVMHPANGDSTTVSTNDLIAEEGGMYHLCRFSVG